MNGAAYGQSDWHLPSPSSTPTSTAPDQAQFETPKCEQSSHFLDAYYTPDITGYQTPAPTPVTQTFTLPHYTVSAPEPSLAPHEPQNLYASYRNEIHLTLPPVDPAQRLSSSPISTEGPESRTNIQLGPGPRPAHNTAMSSFQMHTPPPTLDASVRKNNGYTHQHTSGTSSHGLLPSASHTTPAKPSPSMGQPTPQYRTPTHFPQFQFSPAMHQYQDAGPLSAPAAHTRFSWEAQSPPFSFVSEAMMNTQHQSFGPPSEVSPVFAQWQTPNPEPQAQMERFDQNNAFDPPAPATDFWTTPSLAPASHTASFDTTGSFATTIVSTGVDPNTLFSFAGPLQQGSERSPTKSSITPQKLDTAFRQPYAHQAKELTREKERAVKARRAQEKQVVGSATVALGRPGLQRSNTDSGLRRPRLGLSDGGRASHVLQQAERRPSPLKRQNSMTYSPMSERRPKPKTRLVIDEYGRARTETVEPSAVLLSSMWDDSSSDEELRVKSQRTSFDDPPQRRGSKHAMPGADSDRFELTKRPGSSASMSSLTARLERTPLAKRSSRDINARRFSAGIVPKMTSNSGMNSSQEDVMEEEKDDAQAALKKMMGNRPRRPERLDPRAMLNAHNQRWSQASIDVAKFSNMHESLGQFDLLGSSNSTILSPASLTGSGVLTPSTAHSTASNESTRCVCNNVEPDGRLMVQCESCTKWSHVHCVGLDASRLPPVYVCVFCTGTTPLARGGRIREPTRRSDLVPASPLGYKSDPFFRR